MSTRRCRCSRGSTPEQPRPLGGCRRGARCRVSEDAAEGLPFDVGGITAGITADSSGLSSPFTRTHLHEALSETTWAIRLESVAPEYTLMFSCPIEVASVAHAACWETVGTRGARCEGKAGASTGSTCALRAAKPPNLSRGFRVGERVVAPSCSLFSGALTAVSDGAPPPAQTPSNDRQVPTARIPHSCPGDMTST